MHEVVLYDMAWAGLRHALKMKVRPWISTGKTGPTHSTNSSTVRRPQSSNRMTKSPGDSNRKVNMDSLRKAAIRNATSDPPSPNLPKALPPIPIILIILIPEIQNRSSPISPVEAAVPTINSAVALKGSLRKPKANWQHTRCGSGDHKTYLVPNIHGNMQ